MTTTILIALAFTFRLFREFEDEVARGKWKNWAFKPNSDDGSTAKWVYPYEPYVKRWYYFGYKPKYKERFPFSSTLLSFATDAEHFYQFIQFITLAAFIVIDSIYRTGINVDILNIAFFLPTAGISFIVGYGLANIVKEVFIKNMD
jgi:hypothetical protein